MDEKNEIKSEEPDYYGTGSTRPPKSHNGLIAFLLILTILLGGIASAMGILNIRMFSWLQSRRDESIPSPTGGTDPTSERVTLPEGSGDLFLELNPQPNQVENVPQEGGLSLQQIYTKVIDSVVSITCTLDNGSSSGTGVVLSRDGYLVTNCHVVEDASSIRVKLTDQRVFSAAVVGMDRVSDLAVLYIAANDLTPAEFGDSANLRVGDAVAAIGDPLGEEFRGTMTDGIVSAINRDLTSQGRTMTLIQTNAALNSGNSGGPLLNCFGQVVGINTMKISTFVDSAGVEGIGFAIPSSTVKEIVDQLLTQGFVSGRPSMGVDGDAVPTLYQTYYRMPAGFLISAVTDGGPADEAGLAVGDVILSMDGTRITTQELFTSCLYAHDPGDTVELVVYRSGRQYSVKLVLCENGGAQCR